MIRTIMQSDPSYYEPTTYHFIQGDGRYGYSVSGLEWIFDGEGFTNFKLELVYDEN